MSEPRPTPYDIIFGGPGFDESHFELIREQAEARPSPSATDLFMLPAAGTLLKDLIPESEAGASHHRELVGQVTALTFHAYRFWLHGRQVRELDEGAARAVLTRTEPVGEWGMKAPAPAGYVQLPRNLLWARVDADAPPEPADGFFWSTADDIEGAAPRLDVLLALGVRAGRPGITSVDVSIEAADTLQHWTDVEARPGGVDFANVLPGGELQGYHALTTQAELLKLVARCFWCIDVAGGGAGEGAHRVVHG